MSRIQTVVCAIITSNLRLAEAPGNVYLKADYSKLPKDSVINVSQLIGNWIGRKIGGFP